ncbi:MAG TPA: hypothetical protein VF789_16315 [Thermoanaerobaculia bacterium]
MNARQVIRQWILVVLSSLTLAVSSEAAGVREAQDPLSALAFSSPRLHPTVVLEKFESIETELDRETVQSWISFRRSVGGEWSAYINRRNGLLDLAEGAGMPWIPGHGNTLREKDVPSLHGRSRPDIQVLEGIARAFFGRFRPLFGVENVSLVLNAGRSGQIADHLWYVDFDVHRSGLPIEGALIVFAINNGNLVQFGTENIPPAHVSVPRQNLTREEAASILARYIGGFEPNLDTFVDPGSVHLMPTTSEDEAPGKRVVVGNGYGLAKIWQFVFRRTGLVGTWRGLVDASTGELLEFIDLNKYAQVSGGVYPDSYIFNNEAVFPMPFANVSSGGSANSAGRYNYAGGTVTSTLNGPYIRIADNCGAISKSSNASGQILFGTSAGTDCTTPGSGGAGNTHSSRMQFYWLNRGKEIGRGWLPSNAWLNGQLTANVNIANSCNAYWDGSTVNFYRSGGGCGNTGEITALSLHEYGHGLDANDGAGFSIGGTAEAYGDIVAALVTHKSCIGAGTLSGNCGGYGDACTACSAFRDIDWAKHTSNTPHTVGNFVQTRCFASIYAGGLCGMTEPHCESYPISEAIWDLAERDFALLHHMNWSRVSRLWYTSITSTTRGFICNTTTNPWSSHGCGTGTLWRTMRAADDDDGNLANGTPNSCRLYAAFDRHGMACASDAGAATCYSGCVPPFMLPDLTLTAGSNSVVVSFDSAVGTVADIYRNETGCNTGFAKVRNNQSGASWTDTEVANGRTYYYYTVVHQSGNESCGTESLCLSVTLPGTP